jgi:hypothetical protein
MKRWFLAFLVLSVMLIFALPASAARPLPSRTQDQPAQDLYVPTFEFPSLELAQVEETFDPHAPVRLLVQGVEAQDAAWSFTLIERRWGWEMETASGDSEIVRALALSSLDYLNGEEQALGIFFSVPAGYLETLDTLRAF